MYIYIYIYIYIEREREREYIYRVMREFRWFLIISYLTWSFRIQLCLFTPKLSMVCSTLRMFLVRSGPKEGGGELYE